MDVPVIGQRWINEAELSLGLGTLVGFDERTLRIDFGSLGETRTYAFESSALSRAKFEIGDKLQARDGAELEVLSLKEDQGLICYSGRSVQDEAIEIHEVDLSDFTRINRANQRLFAGLIDKPQYYSLRQAALRLSDEMAHARTRGLISGRTSLIPHQLYIVNEVASRQAPRVLLADEVGLGKTIEAGMILNTCLIKGAAQRVLLLVPEHLINQWLVEMLRRFNLRFSLFGRERIEEPNAIDGELSEFLGEEEAEQANPFDAEQLVICSLSLFQEEKAIELVTSTDWDMLIVDEAHHLEWTPEETSAEYSLVENLAEKVPSVLLLTATPEQLGKHGHFARLRLLDPARFHSFDDYLEEEAGYAHIVQIIDVLDQDPKQLNEEQWQQISQELADQDLIKKLEELRQDTELSAISAAKNALINDLLDRHGTGRLLFRNTRSAIKGFPERNVFGYQFEIPGQYQKLLPEQTEWRDQLTPEISWAREGVPEEFWFHFDPRVQWLFDFLKSNANEKILVIAASAETALDLSEALRVKTGITAAVFHEDMSLVERDRAAAYFADMEDGAPCLICSEIGSEGRNFQFAHHMVLFDLPANPDLLEQRIGRLDRIGQAHTIKIHVPYMTGVGEQLFNFYHHALDAFEHTSIVALQVINQLGETFEAEMSAGLISEATLKKTVELRNHLEDELHQGRDRLLERNSCRREVAEKLVELCEKEDSSKLLQGFVSLYSDLHGIAYEEQSNGFFVMRPTESMTTALNGLPDEGLTLTFDRRLAQGNEDVQFITWDHPVVVSALDSVLSSESGNTSLVTMKVANVRPGSMLLESVFVLECPGNRFLQANRFLPSTRLRILMDQQGNQLEKITEELINQHQQIVKRSIAAKIVKTKRQDIQPIFEKALKTASLLTEKLRTQAISSAKDYYEHEVSRLESLQKVNPSVRPDEIQAMKNIQTELLSSLEQTEVSVDALRLVIFV